MERWENRYARGRNGDGRGAEHSRADRVRSIIIILLLVMLAGVGIVGAQSFAFRGKCDETMLNRAMTECGEAINQVNTLSRSGGSDTAAVLGKIRSNIHAVDVLSAMHQTLYGRALVGSSTLTELYSVIDSYSTKLKNGSATIDELTRLTDQLSVMQTQLNAAR